MPDYLALAPIFLVSAFTMSFAGFGFAMVSVPLLALLLPLHQAVALQFPYCLILFLYQGLALPAAFFLGPPCAPWFGARSWAWPWAPPCSTACRTRC